MFLTQLAAIALHSAGRTDPAVSEGEWKGLLLALTEGKHEPWCVVVPQLDSAAFFQPPVPEGTLEGWKTHEHPDDIDILVTAKVHDIKASLVAPQDIEAWVYALVTLQTTQGYPGRGYTGIARMKGGYGNRPRVGIAPDHGLASRFVRDVKVLLDVWPRLVARGLTDQGTALVWTAAWDGVSSLGLDELCPHFIEVCWRVRCEPDATRLVCRYTTTKNRRCAPEVSNGDVGDAWGPIERAGGLLTAGKRGFHYSVLARLLLSNDFEPAAAQLLRPEDPDPALFIANALARGQGKTEGLHERALTVAGATRRWLSRPEGRALVGLRAEERIAATEKMQRKVLYPALKQLGSVVTSDFDRRVNEGFFDHLFRTLDDEDEPARLSWEQELRTCAEVELQRAISRSPLPSARRFKVISAAERAFAFGLKRHFPDIEPARAAGEGVSA